MTASDEIINNSVPIKSQPISFFSLSENENQYIDQSTQTTNEDVFLFQERKPFMPSMRFKENK